MSLQAELDAALDVARRAADLVQEVYASDFAVAWKGRDNPVTEADRRSNELIVQALRARFPGDGVCAEEARAEDSAREAARGGRCWFVDPLDGTQEFVRRNGEFSVMVGLAIEGRATLGVVVAPVWGRTLAGVVGEGAWELLADGTRRTLQVARVTDPTHARMVVSRSHLPRTIEQAARSLGITTLRPCGSVGLKAALVALGDADLYLHAGAGPMLWDGCAPEAIARAAGAAVTDAAGAPLRYHTVRLGLDQGLVVAAPGIATAAAQALTEALRGEGGGAEG